MLGSVRLSCKRGVKNTGYELLPDSVEDRLLQSMNAINLSLCDKEYCIGELF